MTFSHRTTLVALLLLIFSSLLNSCGKSPETKPSEISTKETQSRPYQWQGSLEPPFEFHSTATDANHRIHIYLPKGYQNSLRNFPVLYMTDAQWAFRFYAETLDWKHKEVILVGVEINSTFRRFFDFTPLGAQAYLHFFKQELIPQLEQKFRVNHERAYMGVSLGALFGGILLCDEPVGQPFFNNYLLFDGSFNFLTSKYIETETARFKASHELKLQIILTGATPGNSLVAAAFAERYRKRGYQGLNIIFKDYAIPHEAIAAPSFSDHIDTVYPPSP